MVNDDPYKAVLKGKGLSLKKKANPPATKSSPATPPRGTNKANVKKPTKTKAELAFEQAQAAKKREELRYSAAKSHKDKVAEFNEKLSKLSEHYDIPKVGPG